MPSSPAIVHRAALIAGSAAILALFIVLAGWSGSGNLSMAPAALLVLGESLPWVALWLGAAAGFGWLIRELLAPRAAEKFALQLSFGIAIMLALDAALGRLGALHVAGGAGAWALTAAGVALLIVQALRRNRLDVQTESSGTTIYWCAAPAIAVLLLSTASAPGWLWDTEYGGYDALSYHLQLPREWMALGAIRPLEHNVYSFLPGFMEAAYHHLMVMRRDPLAAAYACQLLHAAMALIAAFVTARLATRITASRLCGGAAFVLVLGTPWVIVTGSLAYNEMPVLLMLAAGLLLIQSWTSQHVNNSTRQHAASVIPAQAGIQRSARNGSKELDSRLRGNDGAALRLGAGIGLLTAAACGAKLTALGFVALPLVIVMLWNLPPRLWARTCAAGGAVALLVLASWIVSNAIVSRNPVFPFATSLFGMGHWTAEQVLAWSAGHQPDRPVGTRLIEAWHQLARYGIGRAPATEERWHPQWSILPWLALISILVGLALRLRSPRSAMQRSNPAPQLAVIMLVQLVFWIAATHVKSRFMLPMVIPGALSAAWMIALLREFAHDRRAGVFVAAALVLWSFAPVWVYVNQSRGMPALGIGFAQGWAGDGLDPQTREILAELRPAVYLNHFLSGEDRVLFIGEAAPFYYRGDFTYSTTWDRGPLSRLLREHGENASAILTSLRDAGYTHLLVNTTMLERWEEAGWNDPLLTREGVERLAETIGTLKRRWPGGEALYQLGP